MDKFQLYIGSLLGAFAPGAHPEYFERLGILLVDGNRRVWRAVANAEDRSITLFFDGGETQRYDRVKVCEAGRNGPAKDATGLQQVIVEDTDGRIHSWQFFRCHTQEAMQSLSSQMYDYD